MIEITDAEQLRDAIETLREETGRSRRAMAYQSKVGHGTYWLWLRSDPGAVSLKHALAYAKTVGLKLFVARA